jgi:hypothetical protein
MSTSAGPLGLQHGQRLFEQLSVAADQPVAKRSAPRRAPLSSSGFSAAK